MSSKKVFHQYLYDPRVPDDLKRIQQWFAGIITRPINEDSQMMLVSPTGHPMVEEAQVYIAPSATLESYRRIELYNQQYWWRLLTILHESFPLVTRLFGYTVFNLTIGMPYLCKYPSNHWSLTVLGERLSQWIEEEYIANDKNLIYHSACVDWAFEKGFCAEERPVLDMTLPLESRNISLQPHITLFALKYDLFAFRTRFIQEENGDYWMTHDFPDLRKGNFFFVVYRSITKNMQWKEISEAQYALLSRFQLGCTLGEACDTLEKQHPETLEEASKYIQQWFQEWMTDHWLCPV